MEFSGYYYTNNNFSEYVIFVKQCDLIYVETRLNNITITFDQLKNNHNLYGFYLLSIALTPEPTIIYYCDDGCFCNFNPERKWSIETLILDKYMKFKKNNFCGFETDPRKWILTLSSNQEYDTFPDYCYDILNFFIEYEIMQLSVEIEKEEDEINEVNFQIKTAANLMSKFSLPCDIATMITFITSNINSNIYSNYC